MKNQKSKIKSDMKPMAKGMAGCKDMKCKMGMPECKDMNCKMGK